MFAAVTKTWLLLAGACLLSAAAQADEQHFSGTVGKIFDGDSFLVRPANGRDIDVRLQDIDAPEKSQPYGNTARAALVKLIGDRKVFVDVIETDHYGRKVVRVYREPDRLNVAKALVRDGHVWVYRRTIHDRSLIPLEDAARAGHLGLWALPESDRLPPWQYRYIQRQKPKRSALNAQALERAQPGGFHQTIAPVTPGIVVFPGTEGRGEAGARWTVVVPQPVEIADQLYAQR
jgi:endonuclease YncB( thermonuclease family)